MNIYISHREINCVCLGMPQESLQIPRCDTRMSQSNFNLTPVLHSDNYNITLDLLANFRSIGIGGCGTTRRNRTGYPEGLKVPPNAETKVEYHFMTGVVNHGVATLLRFDNSLVSLMTTILPLKGRRSQVWLDDENPPDQIPWLHDMSLRMLLV